MPRRLNCESSTVCKVRPRYVARERPRQRRSDAKAPKHEQVISPGDLAPFHEAVRERLQ